MVRQKADQTHQAVRRRDARLAGLAEDSAGDAGERRAAFFSLRYA